MQVHDRLRARQCWRWRDSVSVKRMQNHAPYGCMAFFGKMAGFSGIFERLLRGQFCTSAGVIQVLCGVNFSRLSSREAASGLNPMAVKMSLSCAE
jgi:hypothetical protein